MKDGSVANFCRVMQAGGEKPNVYLDVLVSQVGIEMMLMPMDDRMQE